MLNKHIKESIERAVERLDLYAPGWRKKVSADLIDQKTGYVNGPQKMGCALCQIFGSYELGLKALDLTHADAPKFGFTAPGISNWRSVWYGSSRIFELQTAEWRRTLMQHQVFLRIVSSRTMEAAPLAA